MAKAKWTDQELAAVLGKMTDREAAERLGIAPETALFHRHRLGIAASRPHVKPLPKAARRLLGKIPDATIARRFGFSRKHVFYARKAAGLPVAKRGKNQPHP